MKHVFILPSYIDLPRKTKKDKRKYLNMNVYRNTHHMENNTIKKMFRPIVSDLWGYKAESISISYIVNKKGSGRYDTMNIVSVVDKFFLDWLVDHGLLIDDTNKNVSYDSITGLSGCKRNYVTAIIDVIGEI